MAAGDINLLKSRSSLSPQLQAIQEQIRWLGFGSIIFVIVACIVVGVTYVILLQQRQALDARRQQVLSAIANESLKEGLYFSLKQRLPVADKALATQRPWGPLFEAITTIAVPPQLSSVTVDDQNVVVLTIRATSIDETANAVNAVVGLVQERKVRNPQLVGLQLMKDGAVQLSLSFIPTL